MSVLFLPPSAGAASVPDASETVSGKIRIATSAEATTGTNDLTAMTPAKVKTVVDAAVVGGVTYKGTFDTSAPVDLSNALQGDLYIISVAGSYQGQTWAVGDHLLINADMGGTLDPAKIDKVDNTDAVTSVAGRTGAVVLSSADISGLATVATSGAYSDLSGTPTLATVATTGAYSDLSGTPSLATVATTGAYSDLSGTPSLATVATTGAYSDLTGTPTLGTASAEDVGTAAGNVVQLNGSAQLPAVDGSLLTNISASVAALDDIGNVDTTGVSANNVLKYDGANWVDGSVAYTEVTGTPTLATVATTGAYSDLSGTPTLAAIATTGDYSDLNDSVVVQQFNTTTTATAINSNALHVFRLYGGGITLTLAQATVANGFALFHNISGSDVTITGASTSFRANGEGALGGSSSITVKAGERRLYYLESTLVYMEVNSTRLEHNGDVNITSVANNEVIKYNSTSGDWENGAVAYADVTGTPTLGTAAAEDVGTSANNVVQLDGTAKLPAVDGSQLTNLPTAGYPALTSASPSSTYTISTSTGFMEIYLLNPSVAIAANIPAPGTVAAGYRYNIKNLSANSITITPASGNIDGASTLVLNVQYSAVTLVSDQTNWFII